MPSHRDQDPSGTTSRPHHTIRYTYGRNSPRRPGSPRPTRITSSSSSLSPSLPATSSSSLPSLNLRGLPSVSSIASSIESEVLPSPSSLRFALLQKPYDNETVQTHEEQVQKLQDDMKQVRILTFTVPVSFSLTTVASSFRITSGAMGNAAFVWNSCRILMRMYSTQHLELVSHHHLV